LRIHLAEVKAWGARAARALTYRGLQRQFREKRKRRAEAES
jgi:hypothetical protein